MNNKVKSEQKLNLKKNQEISLTIEDFTKEGEGLGKYQGFPFFVKDTVIGDEVRVSITKLKKNYGYARLVEIVTPSKDRVTPPCPVARQCGGCKLQQISYEKQLSFKKSLVEGIFLLPVVSATQQELRHLHRKCGVRFATQIKIQYAYFLINSSKKCTISGIISAMTPRKKHLNLLKIYLKKPAVIENLSKPPQLTIKRGSILRQQIPSLLN